MSNAPGSAEAVRVGSIVVEASPSGMRIGTVHGNHRPGEVERGDILDLHEAIGRFIEQVRGEPGYSEHLVARSPVGSSLPMATAPPATASILRGLRAVADHMVSEWDGCATIDGHPIGPKDVRASLAWIKAASAGGQ